MIEEHVKRVAELEAKMSAEIEKVVLLQGALAQALEQAMLNARVRSIVGNIISLMLMLMVFAHALWVPASALNYLVGFLAIGASFVFGLFWPRTRN